MTTPPKTREEWEIELSKLTDTLVRDSQWGEDFRRHLDSIMSLQAEVERLLDESKWCRCIVPRGYVLERCRNCDLPAKMNESAIEKARQPK
jgi:hypothetical protein